MTDETPQVLSEDRLDHIWWIYSLVDSDSVHKEIIRDLLNERAILVHGLAEIMTALDMPDEAKEPTKHLEAACLRAGGYRYDCQTEDD